MFIVKLSMIKFWGDLNSFMKIPLSELRFEFMRSSGPGGQNVNKVETKVRFFWRFSESSVLSDFQKKLVSRKLIGRINKEGELYLVEDGSRSQERNREAAVRRLEKLVDKALQVETKRKMKMPRSVKRKINRANRVDKTRRSERKTLRGAVRKWER